MSESENPGPKSLANREYAWFSLWLFGVLAVAAIHSTPHAEPPPPVSAADP
jgi:hypothetical protein